MSEPTENWETQPKYQRGLEPGELEELNRLRAWREQQERDEHARRQQEQHNLAAQQQPYVQHPGAYPPPQYSQQHAAYPPPQHFAPVQQVTVNNVKRAECPHLLHLVLTLITCGVWLPVWIIHAIIVAARG